LAEKKGFPIHWGSKGFSANINVEGTHVQLFSGYPPEALGGQAIYTGFYYVEKKIQNGNAISTLFRKKLEDTGLFLPSKSGVELKVTIDRPWTEREIVEFSSIIIDLAMRIKEEGLKE